MKKNVEDTLLAQWQPPPGTEEPVGCLATTFTFEPMFFEEQCLRRFLMMDAMPEQEGVFYLIERESKLEGITASVLVDRSFAGVDHSMRWDVLPVHLPHGVQHAKICVLAWKNLIRFIVSSANLSEPAYRTNNEVAATFDFSRKQFEDPIYSECLEFLEKLLVFTPRSETENPAVARARSFINNVRSTVATWRDDALPSASNTRAYFVPNLPASGEGIAGFSAIDRAYEYVKKFGKAPSSIGIVSPFFDEHQAADGTELLSEFSKRMGRGVTRTMAVSIQGVKQDEGSVRLFAPKSVLTAATKANFNRLEVRMLNQYDENSNFRLWHAKLLKLESDDYSAIMIGSSNFTCAGFGVWKTRNAEANILYISRLKDGKGSLKQLNAVWPEGMKIADPDAVEWMGNYPMDGTESGDNAIPLPLGFVAAIYCGGKTPQLHLHFEPGKLPDAWEIFRREDNAESLYNFNLYNLKNRPTSVILPWKDEEAPCKLLVRWNGKTAFWAVNVEDPTQLPESKELKSLTAESILWYLAAVNPSLALAQIIAKSNFGGTGDGKDSAIPVDLDPLKRYNLSTTFLHRVRNRARLFERVRIRLEKSAMSRQVLECRLRGMLGVLQVVKRLCSEIQENKSSLDEAVLTLADFLIMVSGVQYREEEGAISRSEFDGIYGAFLEEVVKEAKSAVSTHRMAAEMNEFWNSVLRECRR